MNSEISVAAISDELLYVAFRSAWLSTFNTLVCEANDKTPDTPGFLDAIPWLTGTAPQIQIDCLLKTWKSLQTHSRELSSLEQCVCYAAAGELARLGEVEHQRRLSDAVAGPRPIAGVDMLWLTSKVRSMQITLPVQVDAMSQLRNVDVLSRDLDQLQNSAVTSVDRGEFLELVGGWRVSPTILSNANGLLTSLEIEMLGSLLQECRGMLNM